MRVRGPRFGLLSAMGRSQAASKDGLGGPCLLYTSDAADERSSVDLGGRRIIKKKKTRKTIGTLATDSKKHITRTTSKTMKQK